MNNWGTEEAAQRALNQIEPVKTDSYNQGLYTEHDMLRMFRAGAQRVSDWNCPRINSGDYCIAHDGTWVYVAKYIWDDYDQTQKWEDAYSSEPIDNVKAWIAIPHFEGKDKHHENYFIRQRRLQDAAYQKKEGNFERA